MSSQAGALITQAHAEGLLSTAGLQNLTAVDLGIAIQAGLGLSVDNVQASEVVLVSLLIDDSSSIASAHNTQAVCDGHNLVLDALEGAAHRDAVLAHARYLNGHVLYPYALLPDCVRMDRTNYTPGGHTPLYDQTAVLLGTVIAKTQDFAANGVPVRSVSLIITDGQDVGSVRQSAATVRTLLEDLYAMETHVVAAMGISNGSTNFRQVFQEMGIADRWILTPSASAADIRRAFQLFSQSVVQAGNTTASGALSLGGFSS